MTRVMEGGGAGGSELGTGSVGKDMEGLGSEREQRRIG